MSISLIAMVYKTGAIGVGGGLIYNNKDDLRYFYEKTKHKVVVMGRTTYESIGKPLKNRINIVITRDEEFNPEGVFVFHSIKEALDAAKDIAEQSGRCDEIMVIGGGQIYEQTIGLADKLYLTEVQTFMPYQPCEPDVYFPTPAEGLVNLDIWEEVERKVVDETIADYEYHFAVYKRKTA